MGTFLEMSIVCWITPFTRYTSFNIQWPLSVCIVFKKVDFMTKLVSVSTWNTHYCAYYFSVSISCIFMVGCLLRKLHPAKCSQTIQKYARFDTVKRYLDVAIHIFPHLCISNGSVLFQECFSMMISLAIWCVKKLMVDTIFVYKYLSWSHLVKPTCIKELFWYLDGKYSYVTKSNEPGALNGCYKLRFCVKITISIGVATLTPICIIIA